MANESQEISDAISSLRVPQHEIDTNVRAAERLVAELKSQYKTITETKLLEGENRERYIKGQTVFLDMMVAAYLNTVRLQGEAEAIRINAERSRDPANALPLIDSNAERTMANQFADAIRELKARIEMSYVQQS